MQPERHFERQVAPLLARPTRRAKRPGDSPGGP